MAIDFFLRIEGIAGESTDKVHKEEIEVESFSWGATNSGSTHVGPGGGTGRSDVQDLQVSTFTSRASPEIFYYSASGKHAPAARLVARSAGETQLEFLTITMTEVLISSYQTGASASDSRPLDQVSLNFAKVKVEYKWQTAAGTIQSNWSEWNIPENVGST